MAVRTWRNVRRSSISLSRRTVSSAYGTAAAARIDRITSVTSSSMSVSPRLLDDHARRTHLRTDVHSVGYLDGRCPIDEIGNARLISLESHARDAHALAT